jgi:hypothetical protein
MAVTLRGLGRRQAILKARKKPKVTIHKITPHMIARLKVKYAAYPTRITNTERDKIRTWLLATLGHEKLAGASFPSPAKRMIMYCDGTPSTLTSGTWQNDGGGILYLANDSHLVPPLERVAILATIARLAQMNEEPDIIAAVATATVKGIKAIVTPVWDGLVIANERPDAIAFNMATYEVAAQMADGKFYLPSGQPVKKVDDAWTVMEF